MTIQITVIIPVFNAVSFVDQAILSALNQKEVAEVIVVDDGSTDGSYERCQKLAKKNKKILLLTHQNRSNKGVSASRNLGLKKSTQEYVSFLDADDFYLPNRFKCTISLLQRAPNLLGTYSGHRIEILGSLEYQKGKMTSKVPSEQLFHFLITHQEFFSIFDLTIRKSLIPKYLHFDESLHFGEDTDFILSLCLSGRLVPCNLYKAVLSRVIHKNNTIHNKEKEREGKFLFSQKWMKKSLQANWSKDINRRFVLNLLEGKYGHIQNKNRRLLLKAIYLCRILIQNPKLLLKIL